MSWELSIIIGVSTVVAIFIYLSMNISRENHAVLRVFFLLMGLSFLTLNVHILVILLRNVTELSSVYNILSDSVLTILYAFNFFIFLYFIVQLFMNSSSDIMNKLKKLRYR